MSTFIMRLPKGTGVRVAIKDIVDMAGLPTTAGSPVWGRRPQPATEDAACLAGLRKAEAEGTAQIVGRTNLHEFCFGVTGVNPWYGTPVNPLDPGLVPGGSSSGSAVAVGSGEADIALGSDTGGSVRIPAACCGISGLKTTWGRVPLQGVWPLAPSLDTVGPMARDVAGLVHGMALLEPGFQVTESVPTSVGRLRVAGVDPAVDAVLDEALRAAGLQFEEVTVPIWNVADAATITLLFSEAYALYGHLLEEGAEMGEDITTRLRNGAAVTADELSGAKKVQQDLRAQLDGIFARVPLLAVATLLGDPVPLEEAQFMYKRIGTRPVNLSGLPAVAIPVSRRGQLPTSLQLVGPAHSEGLLLATAASIESALRP